MWSGAFGYLLTLRPKPQAPANTLSKQARPVSATWHCGVFVLQKLREQCGDECMWIKMNETQTAVIYRSSTPAVTFRCSCSSVLCLLPCWAGLSLTHSNRSHLWLYFILLRVGVFDTPAAVFEGAVTHQQKAYQRQTVCQQIWFPVTFCVFKLSLSSADCLPKQSIDPHMNRRSHTNETGSRKTHGHSVSNLTVTH